MREVTDSFTLSAEMDSSSALDNSAVARLIRMICVAVSKGRRSCGNPSSRLQRYASLFDASHRRLRAPDLNLRLGLFECRDHSDGECGTVWH